MMYRKLLVSLNLLIAGCFTVFLSASVQESLSTWQASIQPNSGCDASGGCCQDCYFESWSLQGALYPEADFTGSNFTGAKIQATQDTWCDTSDDCVPFSIGSDFHKSNFTSANFTNTNAEGIILWNATLDKANFMSADLTGGQLNGASCLGTNFTNATLTGVQFQSISICQNGSQPQNGTCYCLSASDPSSQSSCPPIAIPAATLTDATFHGATVNGANFFGVTMSNNDPSVFSTNYGVDLTGATWIDGTICLDSICSNSSLCVSSAFASPAEQEL